MLTRIVVDDNKVLAHLEVGNRLECPIGCTSAVHNIMLACWSFQPEMRPVCRYPGYLSLLVIWNAHSMRAHCDFKLLLQSFERIAFDCRAVPVDDYDQPPPPKAGLNALSCHSLARVTNILHR